MTNYLGLRDSSPKGQDDIKQVIEILTTTIESVNVRLANITGEQLSNEIKGPIAGISASVDNLIKMTDAMNRSVLKLQAHIEDNRRQMEEMKKQMAQLPEVIKAQQANEFYKKLDLLNAKIEQLVNVQLVETKILREQNVYLQKAMGFKTI